MRFATISELSLSSPNSAHFVTRKYDPDEKERILQYMRSFEPCAAGPLVDDCRTGSKTTIPDAGYDDGIFMWSIQDIYHIEKYDAAVSDDFMMHVLD